MDHHKIIHNDIKPQNYLVKFYDVGNNLNRPFKIVLTDFGLAGSVQEDGFPVKGSPKWFTDFGWAGSEQQGGTPVFASPECLANPDRKDKSTDIFSLGRVFLFIILPKETFLQFLFVSLIKGGKTNIENVIETEQIFNLISKMMRIRKRINLRDIRRKISDVVQIRPVNTIFDISKIIKTSTSDYTKQYIENLEHFS